MSFEVIKQTFADFLQTLEERKRQQYDAASVLQTSFSEWQEQRWDEEKKELYQVSRHGFFTPYRSVADLRAQVRAPFVMPLLCVVELLKTAFDVVKETALCLFNLPLLDFRQSGHHLKEAFKGLLTGIYFAASAIGDAIREGIALITRFVVPVAQKLIRTEEPVRVEIHSYPQDYYAPSHNHGHHTQFY